MLTSVTYALWLHIYPQASGFFHQFLLCGAEVPCAVDQLHGLPLEHVLVHHLRQQSQETSNNYLTATTDVINLSNNIYFMLTEVHCIILAANEAL